MGDDDCRTRSVWKPAGRLHSLKIWLKTWQRDSCNAEGALPQISVLRFVSKAGVAASRLASLLCSSRTHRARTRIEIHAVPVAPTDHSSTRNRGLALGVYVFQKELPQQNLSFLSIVSGFQCDLDIVLARRFPLTLRALEPFMCDVECGNGSNTI